MKLFAGTVAVLLACLLVHTNGQIDGTANVESDRVIKVQAVKEIFRNRNNTALEASIFFVEFCQISLPVFPH